MSGIALAVPATQIDALDRIFAGLKNKSHDVRASSAVELQRYVRRFWAHRSIRAHGKPVRF